MDQQHAQRRHFAQHRQVSGRQRQGLPVAVQLKPPKSGGSRQRRWHGGQMLLVIQN